MDLSKLTKLELWDLENQIRLEKESRENAAKLKVYKLTLPYNDGISFLNPVKALYKLSSYLRTDDTLIEDFSKGDDDVKISLEIIYTDQANAKYCEDYDDKLIIEG